MEPGSSSGPEQSALFSSALNGDGRMEHVYFNIPQLFCQFCQLVRILYSPVHDKVCNFHDPADTLAVTCINKDTALTS